MEKVKDLFSKFYVPISILIIILGIAAAYGIFLKPAKTEYRDKVEYKEDTKITSSLRQEISKLTYKNESIQKQLDKQTDITKNINTVEYYDPITGKLIKREIYDKTQISSGTHETSLHTTTITIIDQSLLQKVAELQQYIKKIETESKVTTNTGLFSVIAGYNPIRQSILGGPGVNLGPSTTILIAPQYDILDNKFSYWLLFRQGL